MGLVLSTIYVCVVTDEYTQLVHYASLPEGGPTFVAMTLFSGSMGIIITLSVLVVIVVGGPIMVNVTGTMKDGLLTYAGFVFFDDSKVSPMVLLGLGLSFAGATFTLINKYKQVKQEKQSEKDSKKTN
mgnify:CR=1 FL=1